MMNVRQAVVLYLLCSTQVLGLGGAQRRPLRFRSRCRLEMAADVGKLRGAVSTWERTVEGKAKEVKTLEGDVERLQTRLDATREDLGKCQLSLDAARASLAAAEKSGGAAAKKTRRSAAAEEEEAAATRAAEERFRKSAAARKSLGDEATRREAEKRAARAATHYEVLGVPRNATADEVRAAYRLRMATVHPDAETADASAFAAAREAYEVLRDGEKRRDYDRELGFDAFVESAVPFVRDAAANLTKTIFAGDAGDDEDARARWAAACREATRREHMVVPSSGVSLAVDRNGTGFVLVKNVLDRLLRGKEPPARRVASLEAATRDGPTLTLSFVDDDDVNLLFLDDDAAAAAADALGTVVDEFAAIRAAYDKQRTSQAVADGLGGLAIAGAGALAVAGIVEAESAIAVGTAAAAVLGTAASAVFAAATAPKDDDGASS